jgi:hypothetical protein
LRFLAGGERIRFPPRWQRSGGQPGLVPGKPIGVDPPGIRFRSREHAGRWGARGAAARAVPGRDQRHAGVGLAAVDRGDRGNVRRGRGCCRCFPEDRCEKVWEASDRICGRRLRPLVPVLVEAMERHGHLRLAQQVRTGLLAMSAATFDRALRDVRRRAGTATRHRAALPALEVLGGDHNRIS